ncbi:DUF938 domain-containing protein [Planctobacterium marinum]|uniref:DUF938 domain-containing protein n=1 Tax=Planctobacterium marinum TaxID=1631968 RepID=UPI001E4262F3|nr:DUF938 domain-containing protein [Planctobacterium marinum]MCC2604742.1 class I SAM-dependent methyltransferase [Planctobacterium marinum]
MQKRFSQACENNRLPILTQLKIYLAGKQHLLEIGSGTGQHASYFAPELPHLIWQTSDVPENHPGINAWLAEAHCETLRPPVALCIGQDEWPERLFDAVYSANTAHIMQKEEIRLLMQLVAKHLPSGGVFCQYGPFTEQGQFSSDSNRAFHQQLIAQGYGGYRDIDELKTWVQGQGLTLKEIINMPANNLMLVWVKV